MIKMTFALAAALYAGFVIWGEPGEVSVGDMTVAPAATAAEAPEYDRPVILAQSTGPAPSVTRAAVAGTVVPDAAVIAASAPAPSRSFSEQRQIGDPVVVNLVQSVDIKRASAADVEAAENLLRVSGSRVNMRSGPSTGNAVVDSLPAGTLTEALGAPVDGWQEIRDVVSGKTGFMSARFLEPA